MFIERNVLRYCVLDEETIANALRKINDNASHLVFTVTGNQQLEGILTDGDLRRWMIDQTTIDLDQPVRQASKKKVVKAGIDDAPEIIASLFGEGIDMVPLLDDYGHLVAIAMRQVPGLSIGGHDIGPAAPALVIAEIGNNHNGSVALAKELVDLAVEAGADCAKFQMRDIGSLYRNSGTPGEAREDLGTEYTLDLLERFNLTPDQMFEVFDHCRARGVLPLCTPWDPESVRLLDGYGVAAFKVASADLTNHDLLTRIAATNKPLIMSTGMAREEEVAESVRLLKRLGANFGLLHTNSTYPAPFKDINLAYMKRLARLHGVPVGYSGHERGFSVVLAAIAMGAKIIEKHFTLDRTMEGNDHKVSLLPGEFRQMVTAIRQVEEAVGAEGPRVLTQGEMINREALAKSLVAARAVRQGETITADMIEIKSPGRGLQPNRRQELIGRPARRDIAPHDFFYPGDVEDGVVEPRPFRFRRPWGVPVRYHDTAAIVSVTNPDFVEYHFSYKDIEIRPDSQFDGVLPLSYTVHCPEMFSGDMLLDLTSVDASVRARSRDELARVVEVANALRRWHAKAPERVLIVTNVGGFSDDGPYSRDEVRRRYERLNESLARVDTAGVEIIPQTMPPFPWHFGGQRYHNLFVSSDDIVDWCRETGGRVCFDVSHSKLACAQFKWSFTDFVEAVAPHTAHLHLADAEGVDGEGLQIGDGDLDFAALARQLDSLAPDASFIPEVWQGHKNGGEGFWYALDRLEHWF